MVTIGLISDTHNQHSKLYIPTLDILIHAGDSTGHGKDYELENFFQWLESLDQVTHKVFIAGNHDFGLQRQSPRWLNNSVHYLEDSGIELEGLRIYGTPWSPFFYDWAFNGLEERGTEGQGYEGGPGWSAQPDSEHRHLRDVFKDIPDNTDILVCHGPPRLGSLDLTLDHKEVGSWELRKRIEQLPNLKAGVYGHIHEGHGCFVLNGVPHYNVSTLNRRYTDPKDVKVIEL